MPTERQLPSPEMLQNKILIKAKGRKHHEDEDSSSSSSSSDCDEELNETRRYITNRRYSIQANTNTSLLLKGKVKTVRTEMLLETIL